MWPRNSERTHGIRATDAVRQVTRSAKWLVCIQTYAEGNAAPQSFSL